MDRARSLRWNRRELLLPAFFASVSSVKTNLKPVQYVQVLAEVEFPSSLLSAYDYWHSEPEDKEFMAALTNKAQGNGAVVLLDSGNYEAYWHSDLGWTPEAFRDAARILGPDLAFCFDEQNPPDDSSLAANVVVDRTTADQTAVGHTMVIPIVHANPDNMAGVVSKVVRALHPVMVAVPERELGNGIVREVHDDAGYSKRP